MVWFVVDDSMAMHPKIIAAGNAAIGLWTRCGSWCAQTLSDGFVPRSIARSFGTIGQCKALVKAGLWIEVEGGYQFHQWSERQQTKSDVEAKRKADRARKAEQRKRRNVTVGHPPDVHEDNQWDTPPDTQQDSHWDSEVESQQESRGVSQPPSQAEPSQASFIGYVEGGSHVSNTRENDPPPRHCDKHPLPAEGCEDCRAAHRERFEWTSDRIGVDTAPPPKCDKHLDDPNPPNCGACKAKREERQAWEAGHARRVAEAQALEKRRAARMKAQAIENCNLCDASGYVTAEDGASLCAHDPEDVDRRKRGMAGVRERMGWKAAAS